MLTSYKQPVASSLLKILRSQLDMSSRQTSIKQAASEVNEKKVTYENELENARPYSEIPGTTQFGFIRAFLPGGACYKGSVSDFTLYMHNKYGDIFRLPGVFGNPESIVCMNPDDFSIIFRNEGQWPYRRSFDSVNYYREVYRKDFFQGVEGIIMTNGQKWADMRTAVNPILMQPKNAILYLDTMLNVNIDFIERIREIRDPITKEMPNDFADELNRLTLESVAAVALNTQLGLFRKNRDTPETKLLVHSIRRFFELAFDLDILPSIWKYVSTPKFREQMQVLDNMTNICNKYVTAALKQIEHDSENKPTSPAGEEKSVLEKLLRIDKRVAVVMALDMILAGMDTTSSSLVGILLCIAKHPDKQEKLFEEIRSILPEKDSRLTMKSLVNVPYLRACIKEGIRLYPVLPGTMRQLPTDLVLSGYRVPKGTDIVIGANFQVKNEKYVPRASEFVPERWLRSELGGDTALTGQITNPFMYVPFGFGPRSCAGKRIVNLEMEITIARLVRNFRIEFNYPIDKAFKTVFINVPNIPLKFKFEEREA